MIQQHDATFLQFNLTQIEFTPQLHANSENEFSELTQHASRLKAQLRQSHSDILTIRRAATTLQTHVAHALDCQIPYVQLHVCCTQCEAVEVARTLDGVPPLAEWSHALGKIEKNMQVSFRKLDFS